MRKKLVWLYILLVLVVIIITVSGFVSAEDTTTSCSDHFTFSSTTPGCAYNNAAIPPIFSAISFDPNAAQTETMISRFENTYRTNLPHNNCTLDPLGFSYRFRWNDADHCAMFAGAYVYTITTLDQVSMKVTTRSTAAKQSIADAGAIIYNLSGFNPALGLASYLNPNKRIINNGIHSPFLQREAWDDYNNNYGVRCPPPPDGIMSCQQSNFATKIVPGLYYVASGVSLDVDGNPIGTDTMAAYLDIKFYTNDSNGDLIEGGVISNRLLSPQELNDKFGNSVETLDWLCKLAGGDYYSKVGCCGNNVVNGVDMDNNTIVTSIDGVEKYSCIDKKWNRSDVAGACEDNSPYKNAAYLPIYSGITPPLISTITDGTDNCCGDDLPKDYGFIASVPKQPAGSGNAYQYMCYADLSATTDFQWLDAITTAYKIKTINKTKDVDVISNSQEWFYCDATRNVSMNAGNPIGEGSTFAGRFDNGEYSCASWLTAAFGDTRMFAEKCDFGPNGVAADCCDVVAGTNAPSTASKMENCVNKCYLAGNKDTLTLGQLNTLLAAVQTNVPTPSSGYNEIDMDLCIEDRSTCWSSSTYSSLKSCDAQPPAVLCNATSFCKGGVSINTTEPPANAGKTCCFGDNPSCEPIANVKDADSCLSNGQIYSPTPYKYCTVALIPLPGNQNTFCCLGSIVVNSSYYSQTALSNKSVMCFKEQGNNILSQCCYSSSCKNKDYVLNTELLSSYDRRVLSKGASIHTLTNFDRLISTGTNAVIKNLAIQIFFTGQDSYAYSVGAYEAEHYPKFDGFKYLEFDLLTDASDLTLFLNGKDMGKMESYSNNGGYIGVIHRISLPLDNFSTNDTLNSIGFKSAETNQRTVVLDNIVLVPETYTVNTKPYYCTGGFEGWVDDLDALPTDTQYSVYGPHMLACRGIASYGWTGTQCCGDDTKPRQVFFNAEFFNDTIAGCFAGSKVRNNQSVAESRGVVESVFAAADELKSFGYSDLLYYNDSFIGCQVPVGKYDNMYLSYDATPTSVRLLASNNIANQQCTVVGPYYCMNGMWRKKIKTDTNSSGGEFPGQPISLKMAPPGIELLKYGFSGN
jgi:hypothetical protein